MPKKPIVFLLLIAATFVFAESPSEAVVEPSAERAFEPVAAAEYVAEYAAERVPREAFEAAAEGFYAVEGRRKDLLALIDFTLPSTEPRLWVIDMAARRVLISSHVAHGRNSGENYATRFSNRSGSHQSSLGFYLTEGTYQGGNGYSLILNGLEPGVNDHARARAIVVHGADYADPALAARQGRLGRSLGCPALPRAVNRQIIDAIKDGAVMFIYGKNNG